MNMKQEIIKEKLEYYRIACNGLLEAFCLKHGFSFADAIDGWVANEVGGTVCCGDLYFNMDVIVTDLAEDTPEGQLLKWYEYTTECALLGVAGCNYRSWLKGCPTLSEQQLDELRKLSRRVEEAREELIRCTNEYKEKGY